MMQSTESRRGRTIVLHFERGDELPSSLVRALDTAEVKAGWVTGAGLLEAAEVRLPQHGDGFASFNLDGPLVLASIAGPLQVQQGALAPLLWASLSKAGELGASTVAGELAWAAVTRVDIVVTVFDDLVPARAEVATSVAPPTLAGHRGPAVTATPLITPPPMQAPAAAPAPAAARPVAHAGPPAAAPVPVPPRAHRSDEEQEVYPEVGDLVSHFAFGLCEVVLSDGDVIRIREDSGRTRNVGLGMLRVGKSTIDPATGKRLFELGRRL